MKTTHQQVLALLLALALLLSLCACGQNTQTEPDEPKLARIRLVFRSIFIGLCG